MVGKLLYQHSDSTGLLVSWYDKFLGCDALGVVSVLL